MQGLTTHFLPTKALKHQKSYLHQGLFNTQDSHIHKFICCINDIILYIENFPLFGMDQGFTNDQMIKLIEFELPKEWKKKLLMQGFNSFAKIPNKIVELCGWLHMSEYIFHNKGDG